MAGETTLRVGNRNHRVVVPTLIATGPIKAATGIAIIGSGPTLIATEFGLGLRWLRHRLLRRRIAKRRWHSNDRFAARRHTGSKTAWQALISGIEPGQSIYGHNRLSCTGSLTVEEQHADRLRAGLD